MSHGNAHIRKRDGDSTKITSGMEKLLVALVVLVSLGLLLGTILIVVRRFKRRKAKLLLPSHRSNRHRSITVTALPFNSWRGSHSYSEKEDLMSSRPSTPTSPVPEIRITFPEEEGPDGRTKSGRVVIVQVGEAGAAFVRDVDPENLPPYQKKTKDTFQSIDLDSVGGLKEKTHYV